jgi:hypothetical protein
MWFGLCGRWQYLCLGAASYFAKKQVNCPTAGNEPGVFEILHYCGYCNGKANTFHLYEATDNYTPVETKYALSVIPSKRQWILRLFQQSHISFQSICYGQRSSRLQGAPRLNKNRSPLRCQQDAETITGRNEH